MRIRFVSAVLLAAGVALPCFQAQAQIGFPEIEPNETKAQALTNGPFILNDNDWVFGITTGSSTTTPGTASADTFLIQNVARPLGIYRHRLVITTSGTAGHTGTIRGLTQTAATPGPWPGPVGTPNAGTDAVLQTSSTATTPPRFVQWYGFGKQEQLFFRVTGTTSTTAEYRATLETVPVVPTFIGTFQPGQITIHTVGQGHSTDTDLWVYDANLDPIVGYGNDDNSVNGGGPGSGLQSWLRRDYTPGVYYLALTNFNFANNQGSPCDDNFRTGSVLDFPGLATNSSTTVNLNMAFTVVDSAVAVQVQATKTEPFQILWFQFEVIPSPSSVALLGLGALASLRRRRT